MYDARMTELQWLERISSADVTATAETRTVVDTGAFKLLLNPVDDFVGTNWATPLKPNPSTLEITAMREAFHAHRRTPRLEFIGECWPDVAGALERAGLKSEGDPQDIMIVTPDAFKPFSAKGVTIRFLEPSDADALFYAYLETQTRGFGYSTDDPTPEDISRWRDQIGAGRRAAIALLESQAAGVGTTMGTDLAEVQGVTTLPAARRRGVAASLSSALVADMFKRGGDAVWLSVEEDAARACYAKIGFDKIGSRLNYSAG
jgi:ribosomal protein S18 acetylase RimI-like enzyme